MINGINKNQISDLMKDMPSRQSGPGKVSASSTGDAHLQISYDTLIEKAAQANPEQANAVQQARQLLASGELDNPENIRAAAENMATFGI